MEALIKHIEEEDCEGYSAEVANFDAMSRLDAFHTKLFLKIKKQIPDENELC
jgi:hypothetical protein